MSRVYVLYTGGTIGCEGSPLAPAPGPAFGKLVGSMPGLKQGSVAGYDSLHYDLDWFEQTLDSSNITPSDWITIAQRIVERYAEYDGFVVLHGTDTMSFTASALSFLLPGLSKPVILTGSQLPLGFTLSDALPNLVGAIVLAGTSRVPECCLYFNSLLMRGNRSVKVNANLFAAFASPNYPALGTVGTEITLFDRLCLPPPPPEVSMSEAANLARVRFQLERMHAAVLEFSIVSVVLYPGIQGSTVEAILNGTRPRVRGMILQAFGEGNGPSQPTFLDVLRRANDRGVVIMDNTQVLGGTVNVDAYHTGSSLAQAGACSAFDMTPEAALAKMVALFGCGEEFRGVKSRMQQSLAGEITPPITTGITSMTPR